MPELVQQGAVLMCPHGGPIQITPTGPGRVRTSSLPAATGNDQFMVSGCCFMLPGPPPIPHPCLLVQLQPATLSTRIKIGGAPAVLSSSQGLCQAPDMMVQGPAMVVNTQTRVRGL